MDAASILETCRRTVHIQWEHHVDRTEDAVATRASTPSGSSRPAGETASARNEVARGPGADTASGNLRRARGRRPAGAARSAILTAAAAPLLTVGRPTSTTERV